MWIETTSLLENAVRDALQAARENGELTLDNLPDILIDRPKEDAHGDAATSAALGLAREAKMNPRAIAEIIVRRIEPSALIEKIEIAGPGFINFWLSNAWREQALRQVLNEGADYGRSNRYAGQTALVEFVSVNPTGPITIGHGRQVVVGDVIARLMETVGYDVTREYYFNDAGKQMRVLGESTRARYLELLNLPAKFPEDGYQGEYIRDIARELLKKEGDRLADVEDTAPFRAAAVESIFEQIRATLKRIGIMFDAYFSEQSLYERGLIEDVVEKLRAAGYAYDKDGAVWFQATAFGLPKDRPIIRSGPDREPTYRLPDIAYHREKIRRGYDRIIDIFGADHNDAYPDVFAGVQALGYDISCMKALIHQLVTIERDGETVKMSTRRADYETLDDLMDEVGEDAVRLFMIHRNMNSHLNFDIDLVKKASNDNPVYYLQYAHARAASLFQQAREKGIAEPDVDKADLSLLKEREETDLIKRCAYFPAAVMSAAELFEPHAIPHTLRELAAAFHLFYDRRRILNPEEPALTEARLLLVKAVQTTTANGLNMLGARAPNQM